MMTTAAQATSVVSPGLVHSFIRSLLVDQQDHEDQHEGQQHAVDHLREQDHLDQRKSRQQNDAGTDDYQK